MKEYIYDIIRVLSDFHFSIWDYTQTNGLQVISAARKYYCDALGKNDINDDEAKEIARFIYYKYQDKYKLYLGDKMLQLSEGVQELEFEIEDTKLVITVDIRHTYIEISIHSPFESRISMCAENSNDTFLIHTVNGQIPNKQAKEKVLWGIATLLERK